MDINLYLPPTLAGLSVSERSGLNALPWKEGVLDDFDHAKHVFIVTSGRLLVDDQVVGPRTALWGIKPFLKQQEREYKILYHHRVLYLDTSLLAEFFFLHPCAMQTYIKLASNYGHVALATWSYMSLVWTVVSDIPTFESIHLALGIANLHAQDEFHKTIYLEFQKDGLSIYDLLQKEVGIPLMKADADHISEDVDLDTAIRSKVIAFNDSVDILNIQFLSMWQINREEWANLFWSLRKEYSNIVIHLGYTHVDFLLEESSVIFNISSDSTSSPNLLPLEFHQLTLPVITTISRHIDHKQKSSGKIKYPLDFADENFDLENSVQQIHSYKSSLYGQWLQQYFSHLSNDLEVIVISDYAENFPGFVAYIRSLWENGDAKGHLDQALSNKIFLLEGKAGILGTVAMRCGDLDSFLKACGRIVHYDVTSLLKPIFPTDSLFAKETVTKYLHNLFQNRVQDHLPLYFIVTSKDAYDVQILSSGVLCDNLMKSVFPPGFVSSSPVAASDGAKKQKIMRTFGKTTIKDRNQILGLCMRFNFKSVQFIQFAQPTDKPWDNVVDSIASNRDDTNYDSQVSGMVSEIINIPYSSHKNLIEQQNEIFHTVSQFVQKKIPVNFSEHNQLALE